MRLGRSTWSYSDKVNVALNSNYLPSLGPNGKHGANEVNVKKYLDFAAGNGFNGVLVEGWNLGWEDWYGHWKERVLISSRHILILILRQFLNMPIPEIYIC